MERHEMASYEAPEVVEIEDVRGVLQCFVSGCDDKDPNWVDVKSL